MSFEERVTQFQRKRREQDVASLKRDQYRAMLKDYNQMKYAPASDGKRVEREITEEAIVRQEKRKSAKKARKAEKLNIDVSDILDFVDITVGD